MPELPEGTINAFIQNKNLAKYGLLKDNEGGFLAATCVEIKYRAPHAIDATLSPSRRRLDGVLTHWLIPHSSARASAARARRRTGG